MRRKSKLLVFLLIPLLVAPIDTALASWMALGMGSGTVPASIPHAVQHSDMAQHQHAHIAHVAAKQMDAVHHAMMELAVFVHSDADDSVAHHDEADCDEHCMNCSSHCFSPGLLSSPGDSFLRLQQERHALLSHTRQRADTLYRPPITA